MLKVNPNYEKLPGSYLFAEIARRVKEYTQAHPDADRKSTRLNSSHRT